MRQEGWYVTEKDNFGVPRMIRYWHASRGCWSAPCWTDDDAPCLNRAKAIIGESTPQFVGERWPAPWAESADDIERIRAKQADAAFLRGLAGALSYNENSSAVAKHRLNEIAMRISRGYYGVPATLEASELRPGDAGLVERLWNGMLASDAWKDRRLEVKAHSDGSAMLIAYAVAACPNDCDKTK